MERKKHGGQSPDNQPSKKGNADQNRQDGQAFAPTNGGYSSQQGEDEKDDDRHEDAGQGDGSRQPKSGSEQGKSSGEPQK